MSVEEVTTILNKKSGLLGVSGKYADHRDIENAMNDGDERAKLANDMYIERFVKYIAEYYVKLEGKVDAIVFTAGLGENAREFREAIINKLNCIGLKIDKEANMEIASYKEKQEGMISAPDSVCPIYVIPTNEEVMIARDAYKAAQ